MRRLAVTLEKFGPAPPTLAAVEVSIHYTLPVSTGAFKEKPMKKNPRRERAATKTANVKPSPPKDLFEDIAEQIAVLVVRQIRRQRAAEGKKQDLEAL